MARVVGILAGRDMPVEMMKRWLDGADVLLAADSGTHALNELGIRPQAIIGDLDSVQEIPEGVELIHRFNDNFTDCDKLLAYASEQGHNRITLLGVEGDQLDHVWATMLSAAKAKIQVRLGLRNGIGWILTAGQRMIVRTQPGRRLSLLPIMPSMGVSLYGVRWPIQDGALEPMGLVSISNETAATEVEISLSYGAAWLFLEWPAEELPVWEP
jgi:thiamine pyrophosphokinase